MNWIYLRSTKIKSVSTSGNKDEEIASLIFLGSNNFWKKKTWVFYSFSKKTKWWGVKILIYTFPKFLMPFWFRIFKSSHLQVLSWSCWVGSVSYTLVVIPQFYLLINFLMLFRPQGEIQRLLSLTTLGPKNNQ